MWNGSCVGLVAPCVGLVGSSMFAHLFHFGQSCMVRGGLEGRSCGGNRNPPQELTPVSIQILITTHKLPEI